MHFFTTFKRDFNLARYNRMIQLVSVFIKNLNHKKMCEDFTECEGRSEKRFRKLAFLPATSNESGGVASRPKWEFDSFSIYFLLF